jgi:uncharacterized repeat protein (TIGR03803 family)
LPLGIGALTAAAVLAPRPVAADFREKVLYPFCREAGCRDGRRPFAGLIMDGAGNFYGIMYGSNTTGRGGHGVVFELTPDETRPSGWAERVLYSFCHASECADGAHPAGPLIMDGAGNLYGTTAFGGVSDHGVVFELTPRPSGWAGRVLMGWRRQSLRDDAARGVRLPPRGRRGL